MNFHRTFTLDYRDINILVQSMDITLTGAHAGSIHLSPDVFPSEIYVYLVVRGNVQEGKVQRECTKCDINTLCTIGLQQMTAT